MSSKQSSPKPWVVSPDSRSQIRTALDIGGYFDGGHIATMAKYPLSEQDAEHIVHCVNNWDELLAAAKELQASSVYPESEYDYDGICAVIERCKAVGK